MFRIVNFAFDYRRDRNAHWSIAGPVLHQAKPWWNHSAWPQGSRLFCLCLHGPGLNLDPKNSAYSPPGRAVETCRFIQLVSREHVCFCLLATHKGRTRLADTCLRLLNQRFASLHQAAAYHQPHKQLPDLQLPKPVLQSTRTRK